MRRQRKRKMTKKKRKEKKRKKRKKERTKITEAVLAQNTWSGNSPYKVSVWALILAGYFPLFHK